MTREAVPTCTTSSLGRLRFVLQELRDIWRGRRSPAVASNLAEDAGEPTGTAADPLQAELPKPIHQTTASGPCRTV
ncbi:MAG TPA: hypothetical protein VMW62_06295 [Chloroflexota bacterium]|nr:hypothetical protein [Chloroflexota bacterium]